MHTIGWQRTRVERRFSDDADESVRALTVTQRLIARTAPGTLRLSSLKSALVCTVRELVTGDTIWKGASSVLPMSPVSPDGMMEWGQHRERPIWPSRMDKRHWSITSRNRWRQVNLHAAWIGWKMFPTKSSAMNSFLELKKLFLRNLFLRLSFFILFMYPRLLILSKIAD